MITSSPVRALAAVLVVCGAVVLVDGLQIRAKAALSQVLLRAAWARTDDVRRVRPWPWADTWPVARLVVGRLGVDQIVLAESGGESLAFGPSHVAASAAPGADGITVLGGHRDTHFDWLGRLRAGDLVVLETADGGRYEYRTDDAQFAPAADVTLSVAGAGAALVLVTCRRPDLAADDPMPRYVVTASALDRGR